MTSSQHGLYTSGCTRPTMGCTMGTDPARGKILKAALSSDCRLKLACMKVESLVIAGQLHGGEYVPGPCTHRPSSHPSWEHSKSETQPRFVGEGSAEGESDEVD